MVFELVQATILGGNAQGRLALGQRRFFPAFSQVVLLPGDQLLQLH